MQVAIQCAQRTVVVRRYTLDWNCEGTLEDARIKPCPILVWIGIPSAGGTTWSHVNFQQKSVRLKVQMGWFGPSTPRWFRMGLPKCAMWHRKAFRQNSKQGYVRWNLRVRGFDGVSWDVRSGWVCRNSEHGELFFFFAVIVQYRDMCTTTQTRQVSKRNVYISNNVNMSRVPINWCARNNRRGFS